MASDTPTVPTADEGEVAEVVASGMYIGRYRVDAMIGSGGMGVVLAAHDPELDRPVAVKMLRRSDPEAQETLVAEAQAMARLRHPNVVTVHDVGVVNGRVFMAMERVDGVSMRTWLDQAPRSWRAIVAHGIGAGRGLAAAHRAGLVHRDVKLANILVGDDEVARIADFGLAARESTAARAGVAGTPIYMPPEQLVGGAITARGDQYALAASLWGALVGAPPFVGDTLEELVEAKTSARLAPATAAAPRWLFVVLRRALSVDPAARYDSVDELVAALERGLGRRRRWAIAAAALAVVAGTAVTAAAVTRRSSRGPDCARAADAVHAVWSPGARVRIATAFAASGRPHAGATVTRVGEALDRRVDGLARARIETCAATFERGAQSAAQLDRRMACLDAQGAELAALIALFARAPDVDVIDRAVDAVAALPDPAACTAAALPDRPPPPPPAQRDAVEAIERRLAAAVALTRAGHAKEARPLLDALVPEARAIGYAPLTAVVAGERASAIGGLGDAKAGDAAYREAAAAAAEAGDDRRIAEAWLRQLELRGDEGGDPADAQERLSFAEVAVARAADPELRELFLYVKSDLAMGLGHHAEARADMETALASVRARGAQHTRHGGRMMQQLARIYYRLDRYDAALVLDRENVALLTELLGADHLDVAKAEGNLAMVVHKHGDSAEAERLLRRSLDVKERTLGAVDPSVAVGLHNLGLVYMDLGRWSDAEGPVLRAIDIRERTLGPEAPILATTYGLLGGVYRATGRTEQSVTAYRRALAITEKASGPDSDRAARMLNGLVRAMVELGQAPAALPLARRAHAIMVRQIGADTPSAANALLALGDVLQALGRPREACAAWAEAHDKLERAFGLDSPELVDSLASTASCLLAADQHAAAGEAARRAIAIVEKSRLATFRAGRARWVHVQVVARDPARVGAARAEAERALADYVGQAPQLDADVRRGLARWLAAHPARPPR